MMTIEEVMELVGERRIARHRDQAFFTVYAEEQANEWIERGATVQSGSSGGRWCWEIHLWSMLDFEDHAIVGDDEQVFDGRAAAMLAFLRERDPSPLRLHAQS